MAINKVVYGNRTLIDLTGDTVTANTLLSGVTAHAANGTAITGAVVTAEIDDTLTIEGDAADAKAAGDAIAALQDRVLALETALNNLNALVYTEVS